MTLIDALLNESQEDFQIERLENRVAHGVRRKLVDAALSGGGEDHDVRPGFAGLPVELREKLVAVDLRHHEIEEDQGKLLAVSDFLQPGLAVPREVDSEVQPFEHSLKKDADRHIVVNDEDAVTGSIE